VSLAWEEVLAWRSQRQHLAARAPREARLAVAAGLAGLHAQVMGSAELSWWARVRGLERGDLPAALWAQRTLVKTWAMRGTLHLLPAHELGLWVAALGGRLAERQATPSALNRVGVTAAQADAITAAIPEALHGRELTREALAGEVGRIAGLRVLRDAILGPYGDQLLKTAAFRGELCFAPGEGSKVRFTHPATWLGPATAVDEATAVRELAARYLRAYGPSSAAELGRWTGTTAGVGKAWLGTLADAAVEVDVEGERLVALSADVEAASAARPGGAVRLLPAYDPLTAATARAADAVIPKHHRGAVWQSAGRLLPVLVADGRMLGTWRHARAGARLTVELAPFADPGAEVRAGAEAEAQRLAAFLGGELDLSWGA